MHPELQQLGNEKLANASKQDHLNETEMMAETSVMMN